MSFTVGDFEDLLKLLREHPDWRRRLLEALLTEELLKLPAEFTAFRQEALGRFDRIEGRLDRLEMTLHRLAEAQAQTQQEVRQLAQAQTRTEQELGRLAEAQARTEERVAHLEERVGQVEDRLGRVEEALSRLAEAQARTEQEVERLTVSLKELSRMMERFKATQDRFGQVVGATAEARMRPAIREWLESLGFRLIDPLVAWTLDGAAEFDGVARAEGPAGHVWVVVSAKARAKPADIKAFRRLLDRPAVRARLRAEGVVGPVWPVVFGLTADRSVIRAASELKVGLVLEGHGPAVLPETVTLED